MPRKYTMNRATRTRPTRSWPVRWRGIITRDVGTDCIFADSEDHAREIFKKDYPMREVVSIGAPVKMVPVKSADQ